MSTKPFAPDEEARGVKGLVEEHTASAGDREAGDREADIGGEISKISFRQ